MLNDSAKKKRQVKFSADICKVIKKGEKIPNYIGIVLGCAWQYWIYSWAWSEQFFPAQMILWLKKKITVMDMESKTRKEIQTFTKYQTDISVKQLLETVTGITRTLVCI